MERRCYNCSVVLAKNEITREHIPAWNLFKNQPEDRKQNIITVDCCDTCNKSFSIIDAEIRNIIGISNESEVENQKITDATIRALLREKKFQERFNYDEHGNLNGVKFRRDDLLAIHQKNFKGLITHEYNFVVPQEWKFRVLIDGDELHNFIGTFFDVLNLRAPNWKLSGHSTIFRYLISAYVPAGHKRIRSTEQDEQPLGFATALIYYDRISAWAYCLDPNLFKWKD